jgi:hypothetical protein
MDNVTITANIIEGSGSNPNIVDGATVQTNVTEGTPVTGNVVTGAKGDTGDTGPQGDPGTIVAVSTTPPVDPQVGDLWVDIS